MSGINDKRVDGYNSEVAPNMEILQTVTLSPVVTLNGEHYLQLDPERLENYTDQPYTLYFILPTKVDNNDQSMNVKSTQQFQTNEPNNSLQIINVRSDLTEKEENDDVILVKDEQTNNSKNKLSQIESDHEGDPLFIREHVSYAVAKRSNQVVPTENIIKHNEFTWATKIRCDEPNCNVVLTSYYEKKVHMEEHNYPSVSMYKCHICNMRFSKAIDRNKHVVSHSVPETYKCDVCLKGFSYYASYVQHLFDDNCDIHAEALLCCCGRHLMCEAEVHCDSICNPESEMFICICDTKFLTPRSLEIHQRLCIPYKKKIEMLAKTPLNNSHKRNKLADNDVIVLG